MKALKNRLKIAVLVVVTMFSLSANAQMFIENEDVDFETNMRKLYHLYRTLNKSYVEELSYFNLVEATIRDVLGHLDPFAIYLTPSEVVEVKKSFYSNTKQESPSFAYFKNSLWSYTSFNRSDSILNGDGSERLFADVIASSGMLDSDRTSVDVAYEIAPKIGYVKINRFSASTTIDTEEAVKSLGDINSIIVDLRGNGGGFLRQSAEVADIFLSTGKLITYTEGRTIPRSEIYSKTGGLFESGDVVILVDEYTASASELLAGAIQDWDRGTIVGRQTFGKGLVQQQVEFEDGSAMRVTVARYHTPSGRVIQKPYDMGKFVRNMSPHSESREYRTMKKGRVIRSDGGIRPDVYVEPDSASNSFLWTVLVEEGYVISNILRYYDAKGAAIEREYVSFDNFAQNYSVPESLVETILHSAIDIGLMSEKQDMSDLRRIALVQIKAVLAEKIWGKGSFFKILNMQSDNSYINTALMVLKNQKTKKNRNINGITFDTIL